ncbi:MAG TPA: DUF2905 domain-containing protein [Gammaproteobacteria bacterium]|nr:DUF2905 domain-containing protein [Gammaproteobacteria bacterium]
MSRTLIIIGAVCIVIGILWPWIQKMNLGRLPGDIIVEKENFNFYFPLMTSIIISLVLTLIFWLFRK